MGNSVGNYMQSAQSSSEEDQSVINRTEMVFE